MNEDRYRFWEGPGPAPDEFDDREVPPASELAELQNERGPARVWTPEELEAARYNPETDPF